MNWLAATLIVDAKDVESLSDALLEAGAQVVTPGCGVCQPRVGFLSDGEVCITSTTRNFKGRMGADSEVYLASPAAVAWTLEDATRPFISTCSRIVWRAGASRRRTGSIASMAPGKVRSIRSSGKRRSEAARRIQ